MNLLKAIQSAQAAADLSSGGSMPHIVRCTRGMHHMHAGCYPGAEMIVLGSQKPSPEPAGLEGVPKPEPSAAAAEGGTDAFVDAQRSHMLSRSGGHEVTSGVCARMYNTLLRPAHCRNANCGRPLTRPTIQHSHDVNGHQEWALI